MAEIYTSKFQDIPVVTAYCDNRPEYLSVVKKSSVGNIYVCRVENIVKNISSAFVKFDNDELGYISTRNINPALILNRSAHKGDEVKCGDILMLQVEADPIKTKKAKMSSLISISGKYTVVTLGRIGVGASIKLGSSNRERLTEAVKLFYKDLLESSTQKLNGSSFGVIIRTSCLDLMNGLADQGNEDIVTDEITKDMEECVSRLILLLGEAKTRTAGTCLYENSSSSIEAHIEKARSFLKFFCPDEEIRLLEDTGIKGINHDIEELFHRKVWLKSGAYLIIEQLESFNAIDVNTGKAIHGKKDVIAAVNKEAAKEIMRQIRLRNLTGMILIDFINMKDKEESEALVKLIKALALKDTVHTEFIDITGLGIMELTRNKNSKSLKEIFSE